MYNRILLPLDGSELAECVLTHTLAIAIGCRATEVTLLRILEPMQLSAEVGEDLIEKVRQIAFTDARNYLVNTADRLKPMGLTVNTEIKQGKAADEILNYAMKNLVDLIVMSSHGRSGVARWTLGSVTDKVVRHSLVPVLTITPTSCRRNKIYKVTFGNPVEE